MPPCPSLALPGASATRMTVLILLVLAAAIPGTAAAQERPVVQPTRDVTVTYKLEGAAASVLPGGVDGPVRMSWDAARQRLRADSDGRQQVAIVDLRQHTAVLVDNAMHAVLALPARERDLQPLTLDGATLTRRGNATVAGLACVNWDVQASRGNGTVCLTPDGVPLRAAGTVNGKRGGFTATRVTYGTVDPALFTVPPGYFSLSLPSFARRG